MPDDRKLPETVEFDHTSQDQVQCPHALYKELRETCPVAFSDRFGGFFPVTRYDDVKEVFSDYQTFSSSRGVGLPPSPLRMIPIDTDPPVQTRVRKLLNPLFTVERFAALEPRIRQVANELIDNIVERGHADLGEKVIRPLLATIVMPVIGVPFEDRPKVSAWVNTLARERGTNDDAVNEAAGQVVAYLTELAERRGNDPEGDDVLATVLKSNLVEHGLPEDVAWRVVIIVLLGGLDTTSAVMSEAVTYLANNPDEARKLLDGEYQWDAAIEELVRWTSPVQGLFRTVTRDTVFEGVELREGDWVMGVLGSANRDPSAFSNPDRIQLDRQMDEHLGFGRGAHICLGRNLARLEIRVFLETLLTRLPDLKIAPDFEPVYSIGEARGMKSLQVVFSPGRRLAEVA